MRLEEAIKKCLKDGEDMFSSSSSGEAKSEEHRLAALQGGLNWSCWSFAIVGGHSCSGQQGSLSCQGQAVPLERTIVL